MRILTIFLRQSHDELGIYFVAALVIFIIYWFRPWFRSVIVALKLPGPPAVPILGNVLVTLDSGKFEEMAYECYQKWGPIVRGWVTIRPIFVILEPKDLQHVLSSTKHTEKNFFYTLMHNFIGKGLITNSGNEWKYHRKYIQPYFSNNFLDTYVQTFANSSENMVQRLKDKDEINITGFVNDSVLDILHESILGVPMKLKNGADSFTSDSPFRKGQLVLLQRLTKPWLLFDKLYKFSRSYNDEEKQRDNLHSYTRKMMVRKREEIKRGTVSENKCLLEVLMEISENNRDFTEMDVINETCTFMLAGQDSVAAAASFALLHLAQHQDIQEKVLIELNEIFQGSDRSADADDIRQMKYLEQCIKETMRLCPSVPIVARKLGEDVTLGNIVIPAQSDIMITPFVTHRLPHIYPDPEKYDPERFSPEMCENRHPFAYLPFSAGPRNCIGYKLAYIELKTLLSTVLRKYHFSVKPGYKFRIGYRVTLRAQGGIWLTVRPRGEIK